jgi:predicted GNAT family N-acyltransferase
LEQVIVRRAATPPEIAGARALRIEVFVGEQGVPEELELDALDAAAVHAVALNGAEVVGTGRLVHLSDRDVQIGRMAVRASFRRRGVGSQILRLLEDEAREMGAAQVVLHAQSYVSAFYRGLGYQEEGLPFFEAGIEHILMRKTLPHPS